MHRLRRAPGVLARTEAQGLSAHLGAGAQIFERSRPAVPRALKSGPEDGLPARPRAAMPLPRKILWIVRSFGMFDVAAFILTNKMFALLEVQDVFESCANSGVLCRDICHRN